MLHGRWYLQGALHLDHQVTVRDAPQADQWLAAIARPPVRAALEQIYGEAAAAIAARGPVCWASGRCCNFKEAGHRLYVTGLEAAYLISMLDASARRGFDPEPSDSGRLRAVHGTISMSLPQANAAKDPVSGDALREWLAEPGPAPNCVFQVGNLCSVHTMKPLACRLYFCDRTAQGWQSETLERLIAEVRGLHDRESIGYRYGEWRETLAMFAER